VDKSVDGLKESLTRGHNQLDIPSCITLPIVVP